VTDLAATPAPTRSSGTSRAPDLALDAQLEGYRRELKAHCRRMLRCPVEAEDATQETLLRAWRGYDRFEGRAALRSWLYHIATNVCLDLVKSRQRRPVPVDLMASTPAAVAGAAGHPDGSSPSMMSSTPRPGVLAPADDPAELVVSRETIRLAFVAALQRLPQRQRAVLILRDVLRWKAGEVATLLGTTTPAVNSMLQRARTTLATASHDAANPSDPLCDEDHALVRRYVDAFQRHDVNALVRLLQPESGRPGAGGG
jgi:RNA polymerase sigma-70 factor, ECF subfamily